MNSTTLIKTTTTSSFFSSCSFYKTPSKQYNLNPKHMIQLTLNKQNKTKLSLKSLKCFHQHPNLSLSCSTTTTTTTEFPIETNELVSNKLQRLVSEFRSLTEPIERVKRLLHYAAILPPFNESGRLQANRVTGCTTQVWLEARMDEFGRMRFRADSDSEITKGFCSCLVWMLDGADPEEVLSVESEDLMEMNVGVHGKEKSRVNTWHNVLIAMQKRTKSLVAEREEITSLLATRLLFQELVNVLKDKKIVVVAHFHPHIHISDSLIMAEAGCRYITVLGVDFMSENVCGTILDQAGFGKDGRFIEHDLFGHEVVDKIKEIYSDSYPTAHFEVLEEMFSPAFEAKRRGMGVAGSTQDILDFIKQRVQEALDRNLDDHLQFVLGIESGMVTSIVVAVSRLLSSFKSSTRTAKINIEIVFLISSDSNSRTSGNLSTGLNSIEMGDFINLFVVPGVTSGEGCSMHSWRLCILSIHEDGFVKLTHRSLSLST